MSMTKREQKSRSSPSTTPEDREARRLRILEAAAAEFAKYGFDATNVESIASRADIGKGTIYNYIGNKDELFAECLQLFCDELRQALEETVSTGTEMSPLARARLISRQLADLGRRRNDFVTMYFASIFGANPRGNDLVVKSAREVIAGLEELAVAGQKSGMVRSDVPADLVAALVFMNRLVFSRMLDGLNLGHHSWDERIEFLFNIHWSGIGVEQAP
jgi:TetR/AcrR family transcriptional regulator, cholesterol catabolism regulator